MRGGKCHNKHFLTGNRGARSLSYCPGVRQSSESQTILIIQQAVNSPGVFCPISSRVEQARLQRQSKQHEAAQEPRSSLLNVSPHAAELEQPKSPGSKLAPSRARGKCSKGEGNLPVRGVPQGLPRQLENRFVCCTVCRSLLLSKMQSCVLHVHFLQMINCSSSVVILPSMWEVLSFLCLSLALNYKEIQKFTFYSQSLLCSLCSSATLQASTLGKDKQLSGLHKCMDTLIRAPSYKTLLC